MRISTGDFIPYSRNSVRRVITLALAMVSLLNAPLGPAVANRQPAPRAGNETYESVPSLSPADRQTKARVSEAFGRLPLRFESNAGQTDPRVRFLSRGPGYSLFLTPAEAVVTLQSADHASLDKKQSESGLPQTRNLEPAVRKSQSVVRMKFVNANTSPKMEGIDPLPGKSNYLIGNDPRKWRKNVTSYAKAHYKGVYPGIDLVYYGNQQQLEYDFIVAPGADPKVIKLNFTGTEGIEVDARGALVLHTTNGDLRQQKPVAYQEINGRRQEIAARFLLIGEREVGFELAHFDRTRPLVIDPVLIYSTFLGGSGSDFARDITVDSAGNAYVTGFADSSDFPTANPLDPIKNDGAPNQFSADAFVAKLNPAGSDLIFSTYLGGAGAEDGAAITVDKRGVVYVGGHTTSIDFPLMNPLQSTLAGVDDAFVVKLNAAGSALVYSTYLGGSNYDAVTGMTIDTKDNIYLTGFTYSTNFPTKNPFQSANAGAPDEFVTKLNAAGSALVYSTYLGGSGQEGFFGPKIAVDNAGCAYVTEATNSADFPTFNAIQPTLRGALDAFVTKFDSDGKTLVYSTYLGGSSGDNGSDIAIDAMGNVYVTGATRSTDYPTVNPIQPALAGGLDLFVTKINQAGSALTFSSYLGGTGDDNGTSIAVDSDGRVYLLGNTFSRDFPNFDGVQPIPDEFPGWRDAFLVKLNADCSGLEYSTYLGGRLDDVGLGIASDGRRSVYVTGQTISVDFRTTPGAFQRRQRRSGLSAAFILKISDLKLQEAQ